MRFSGGGKTRLVCAIFLFGVFSLVFLDTCFGAGEWVESKIEVNIKESCTLSTGSTTGKTYTIYNGQYKDDIEATNMRVQCNHNQGFAVYAIGFSNDTDGNNEMIATSAGLANVPTGTLNSGPTSQWAMKIRSLNDGSDISTIHSPFNDYAAVPDVYTKVASVDSSLNSTIDASIAAQYAVYMSQTQAAGTYVGKVKYTVVFPSSSVPDQ